MKNNSVLINEFKELLLSSEELELILSGYKKVSFKKGDFIIKQGVIVNSYYLVEKGFLRSFVIDVSGNEVTTNFYLEGSIVLEETSFFLRTPTKEYIQVVEDCELWTKDFDTFQKHFNQSEKYREWGRAHLAQNFFAFKEHSLTIITESATDRYKKMLANNPEIIKKSSLKHIASFLGITDTSLSRIRKEIVK
ncbi:Crp/Fnr family transcriptional regulator [Tenacibaculum sp. S7007]|uniref:Crp/Fnr family transcriptional regulator n=1 Tax=Tenacibaculum pelagium TaxID=2759527 RepID=A0A839ANA5_9FLAO|nr:Crp/Fnr family transcriptional regulator [Tenacibaculum pelagium]MBA6156575.1 Crp/Fnr family transcriptional regulator [Tenacibaculum pelagium]